MEKILLGALIVAFLAGIRVKKRSGYVFSAALITTAFIFEGNGALLFSSLQELGLSVILSLLFGTFVYSLLTLVIAAALQKFFGDTTHSAAQSVDRNP